MTTAAPAAPTWPVGLLPTAIRLVNEVKLEPLFHYTDKHSLAGMLKSGSMWATLIQFLNDSREYIAGFESIAREIAKRTQDPNAEVTKLLAALIDAPTLTNWARPGVGVISFSTKADDLSQWRAYAGGSGGCCIGFNSAELRQQINAAGGVLVPVIYDAARQEAVVQAFCDDLIASANEVKNDDDRASFQYFSTVSLQVVCSVLKHPAFVGEDEWRAVIFPTTNARATPRARVGRSTFVPYYEIEMQSDYRRTGRLPFQNVIVGPSPHPELAVTGALVMLGIHDQSCPVTHSTVPFRDW